MRALQFLCLLFILPHCASVERQRDETWVEVDGHWVAPHHVSRGCDSGVLDEQQHRQLGGSVTIERRDARGLLVGGNVSVGSGVVTSATFDADRSHYLLGSVGVWAGYDWRFWGIEGGIHGYLVGGEPVLAMPFIVTRAGRTDKFWFEASMGARRGIFDGELLGLRLSGREGPFSGSAGFGFYARTIKDGEDGMAHFASVDDTVDAGGLIEAHYEVSSGFALGLGGVLSNQPSAWLSLRFRLPSWEDTAD